MSQQDAGNLVVDHDGADESISPQFGLRFDPGLGGTLLTRSGSACGERAMVAARETYARHYELHITDGSLVSSCRLSAPFPLTETTRALKSNSRGMRLAWFNLPKRSAISL